LPGGGGCAIWPVGAKTPERPSGSFTPDFYLHNGFFWVKIALFFLVLALEIVSMATFLRWRFARSRETVPVAGANLSRLTR